MTWNGKFRVQNVQPGPGPIQVTAVAQGPDLHANTEGNVSRMELRIDLDQEATNLKPGDYIDAGGSFAS